MKAAVVSGRRKLRIGTRPIRKARKDKTVQIAFQRRWSFMLTAGLAALFVLAGCVGFQVGSEIQAGRRDLLIGNAAAALPHFQRAAQLDPEYRTSFTPFKEGVWTYVGRSQYATGDLSGARQNLERAVSDYRDDYLGRIYLGLTLVRQRETQKGLQELKEGMNGLHEWLDYAENRTRYGIFWDPRKEIRSEIKTTVAMIDGRETNLEKIIANGEWLGKTMEQEIDLARRDEENSYKEGDNDRDGHR